MRKRLYFYIVLLVISKVGLNAQEYHGISGLLQTPSAEADSAGTFRGNISWVDKRMLPDLGGYGDGVPFSAPCYTIGMSFFRWLQISYTETLVKMHPNRDKTRPLSYCNEDRHINIKLNPLYEGRWWPAIAIGWDDIGHFKVYNTGENEGNGFFQNIYIASSKHFDIKGHELGAHLAYRYYPSDKNRERRGLAGGLTLRPAFYKELRLITEWDGIGVNAGADALLWRHLFAQVALVHGKGFSGGLGYRYQIRF